MVNKIKHIPQQKKHCDFNIKIKLTNFTEGVIKKPIAIPGTYQRIEQKPQGFLDVLKLLSLVL